MKTLIALPGSKVVTMLQALVDKAPARMEINGITIEIQKETTLETAIEKYEETFGARWGHTNFKLNR
jgi:hypothetical protein